MKTQRELRRTPGLKIRKATYEMGYGDVTIGGWTGSVIWTTHDGWDHVSVSPYNKKITPSWNDMCRLKDMFFEDEEEAFQFHPKKSEYVNMVSNCLHLWRPNKPELLLSGPRPYPNNATI